MSPTGVELTREGSQDDPLEGDTVKLLCRAYLFPSPPTWTYFNSQTGQMEPVDEATNTPRGLIIFPVAEGNTGTSMLLHQQVFTWKWKNKTRRERNCQRSKVDLS